MTEISIIFKKRNSDDKYYHTYLKSYKNGKTELISLKKKFLCDEVNWGGKTQKEKIKEEKLRLKGEYIKPSNKESKVLNQWFNQILTNKRDKETEIQGSFIEYLKNFIDKLNKKNKFGTRNQYKNLLKNIEDFLNSKSLKDLNFYKIDNNLIEEFQNFLTHKEIKNNTINNQILKFRKLYELSIKEGLHTPLNNIFNRYEFLKSKPSQKESLTIEEVKSLLYSPTLRNPIRGHYFHLDEEGYEIFQPIEISKNIFLFQIFGGGLRISDTLFLQFNDLNFENDKCFIKTRSFKTDSLINIPLNEIHYQILKKCFSSKYQFTRYENHVNQCPQCNSINIISYGYTRLKNNDRIKKMKCIDCLRQYYLPKEIDINYIFKDVNESHFKLTKPKSKPYLPIHIINEFNERHKRIKELEEDKTKILEILERPKSHRESYKRIHNDDKRLLELLENPESCLNSIENELNGYDDWLDIWWRKFITEENNHYFKTLQKMKKEKPNDFIFNMLKSNDFTNLKKNEDTHYKNYLTESQYTKYLNKSKRHNSLLKKIEKLFNFKISLTTHTGRHTFTRMGLNNDVSIYSLSKYLSHKSIKTTEKYLEEFNNDIIHKEIEDKILNKFRI